MKFKKFICAILSFVCMICFGLGISFQATNIATAEAPTVTVAINQYNNNVDWDATQKRVLLDVVDKATGAAASFTAWENMTSVIGNGVTMNGTGANLNFFGSTGDGVSVIYPSTLEDGAVFSIAAGTEINGYVFPEFTVSLVNGKWVKEPTVTVAINQGANNVDWDATQKRVLLNVVDKATGAVASFTAWENMNSAFGTGITMNGTGANLNFFGSTGDGVSVIYPSSLEDGAVFNIAIGTEVNGNVFPEFTLYLVNGKWQATESAPDPVDPVTESVTITNIHNRYGDGWGQRLLIFLSNSDYTTAYENLAAKLANTNVLDYVNVYTSETEYKTLREIHQGNATGAIWGENNSISFDIDPNYHGTAVYAVEIKAGAQFPAATNDYTTYVVDAGITYYNVNYQSADTSINSLSLTWTTEKPVDSVDPVTESVTITNIHNRYGDGWGQRLLIFLSNSDYTTAYENLAAKLANTNVLDYVNVYTSETEYKTLREIHQGNATGAIWGENNSISFDIDPNYHGTAVYAVEIKAGAQFPAATNDYTTYVVDAGITYYNSNYNSTDTSANGFSIAWTTEKPVVPETPVEPEPPVEPSVPELGTPDVQFVELHNDNNNSVWGGTTRAVRLVFSENFTAKAYDGNEGGFDAATIANVRHFVKINGQSLSDVTFLQIDNENSITFLYDESLLSVASGTKQTIFTIEEGAPFGGRYLPAVTLYFNGETWQTEAIDIDTKLLGIVATQNNTSWDDAQNSVRVQFNYSFNNTENYNINDADGLNMLSKLTFNGVALTGDDILIFTEDIGGNTITMVYKKALFDREKQEGVKYHTLALTESVNYLGVDIPAFTLYLRNDAWITEMLPTVEMVDIETAVGYNTSNLIHIRDWNLDGDETTAVNNMILFFLPSGGFPEAHNLFLNLEKVAEYNVFDKIKLHMITPNSAADENGFVTLGQVFNAGGWQPSNLSGGNDKIVVVNMWETENCIAFSMGAEYTAESFDYIIIEEGCEFPNYYYTNNVNVDYVQNGESVAYEDLEKVSFWQTHTVKMFTNPADFQGPSLNTNWGVDTNMGEITVSGVDYADGYVIIQLENSNYPTEADGDNLNQNIPAGNVPMSLNMLADIYVNGISLYDRVVHFGGNGITAYYNYNGYGNFAINVVLADANEVVTEIIVGKDLRIPLYGMSDLAAAAYGTMYKEVAATVSFSKDGQSFVQDEEIFWSVIFNDGKTVKTAKVAHGAILAASDIPETPVKEGYEFVAWVYGIDGMYTFAPTSNIASCYYLTATWKEASETPKDSGDDKDSSVSNGGLAQLLGGCKGVVGSIGVMASALTLVGICLLKKKEN